MIRTAACRPILLTLWLALCASACSTTQVDFDAVDDAVGRHVGREVDESGTPLESELREHAAKYAVATNEDESEPRHFAALLNVGEDALTARMHLIRTARESVDVQVYVWGEDLAGGLMFYELLLAARRGVKVRILIDQLANRDRNYGLAISLAHENMRVQVYNPVREFTSNSTLDLARDSIRRFERMNERMHNKVVVVDDELAIVGGRNIEDHYFDLDPEFSYLDRDLLVAGPVVADVVRSFQDYWDDDITVPMERIPSVAREVLRQDEEGWELEVDLSRIEEVRWLIDRSESFEIAEVIPHTRIHEVGRVAFEADEPEKDGLHDWNTWQRELGPSGLAIRDARERLLLQSNYLVFSQSAMRHIEGLRARGIEIVYSTNSLATTANLLTYSASRKQKLDLVHLGMDIRELRPLAKDLEHFLPRHEELSVRAEGGALLSSPQVAIHAKSVVVDDDILIVGSHNFDPRSSLYNTEAVLTVWDLELAAELANELELLNSDGNSWICHHVDHTPVWNEVNEVFTAFSRALPILDIWPWRGYSMYQLREGHESVPVDDPSFFEHYEKVGELPEVGSTTKTVKTHIFSAFIAPFWNLL